RPSRVPTPHLAPLQRRPDRSRTPLMVGAVLLALVSVAACGVGWCFRDNLTGGAPTSTAPTESMPVVLSNPRVDRTPGGGPGLRLDFQVNSRPAAAATNAAAPLRYVWVVRSSRRTIHEQQVLPTELNGRGMLQAAWLPPSSAAEGPLETYLESEC